MLINPIGRLWDIRHPEAPLQLAWNFFQLGILILPLYPTVGAILLGCGLVLAWLRKFQTLIHNPINWGLGIFTCLSLFSAVLAWQKQDAFLGIFNFFPFFLMFAATSVIVRTPDQLRRIGWYLSLVSLPINLLGFAQLFLRLQTPPIWEQIFGWSLIAGGNPTGRISSVFIYANIYAAYTAIIFTVTLGLWLDAYQHIRQQKQNYNLHFLLISAIAIINLLGLIFSNSRNAWLIAIIAAIAWAIYQGWRIIIVITGSLTTSVLLAAYSPPFIAGIFRRIIPEFFWGRLNDSQFSDRPITLLRKTQWDFTLMMARDRPWTGWGLRNFTPLYQAVMKTWLGHPHNLYLMLAGEVGIPATLLFVGILIWILIASVQVLRYSRILSPSEHLIVFTYLIVFVALLLLNTFDVTVFDLRLNTLFWVLTGGLLGNVYHSRIRENLLKN